MSPADALARAAGIDLGAYRHTHIAGQIERALKHEQIEDVPRLAADVIVLDLTMPALDGFGSASGP